MRPAVSLLAGLLAGLLAAGLAAMPAHATPWVTASASAGATDLPLDGEGSAMTRIVKVADLGLGTDAAGGLTLTVSSGALTWPGGSPIAFQVALVPDGHPPPAASSFAVASGATLQLVLATAGSSEQDLYILYTAAALQDPGPYAATISLDVVDN